MKFNMSSKNTNKFLFLLLANFVNFSYEFKLNPINKENFGFEKSVAHILKTEMNETGNLFIILHHSLKLNDENLDALMGELNRVHIPLITYTQIMVERR